MCGIAGIVEGAGFQPPRAMFASALAAIRHRGPDDEGIWSEDGVTFGHRRLSIVDLSPAGHQPMHSACGRYVLTYNGEIYNHNTLRAELSQPGRAWRGASDSEVLIELIAKHGIEAALAKIDGMFAFAIWDRDEKRLFLARDRFGEKPLYYAVRGAGFAFASELTALEHIKPLNLRVSVDSVAQYFANGYVPAPASIYENVFKLPPASFLTWRAGEAPAIHTYWSTDDIVREAGEAPRRLRDMQAAVDELDVLLRDSVAERMVADVPVGVFLSGGIDSSLITAIMQQCAAQPVTTLTLGFEDARLNEADHARAIAKHLGTRHIEEVATADQALAVVTRLGRMYDEPLADSSQIPTYLVSEMARHHVTVVLSGDGGDEGFAGYRRHFATPQLWRRMRSMPMRGLVKGIVGAVPVEALNLGLGFLKGFADRYGGGADVGPAMKRVAPWLDARSLIELHELSLEKWPTDEHVVPGAIVGRGSVHGLSPEGEVDQLCLHDMHNYLPGDILAKVDRASMAVSLETRIPLLDPEVVRFALSLPPEMRLQGTTGKVILRELLKRYVPEPMFTRRKTGFTPPIEAWLLGPMREWAEDLLSPSQLSRHGLLDTTRVRAFWERYKRGGTTEDARAWAVLQFQSWMTARGY